MPVVGYCLKNIIFRVNIEILGTLLKNGIRQIQFGYILHIMEVVKQENLKVNDIFIKHLEAFNDKCLNILEKVFFLFIFVILI